MTTSASVPILPDSFPAAAVAPLTAVDRPVKGRCPRGFEPVGPSRSCRLLLGTSGTTALLPDRSPSISIPKKPAPCCPTPAAAALSALNQQSKQRGTLAIMLAVASSRWRRASRLRRTTESLVLPGTGSAVCTISAAARTACPASDEAADASVSARGRASCSPAGCAFAMVSAQCKQCRHPRLACSLGSGK